MYLGGMRPAVQQYWRERISDSDICRDRHLLMVLYSLQRVNDFSALYSAIIFSGMARTKFETRKFTSGPKNKNMINN